MRLGDRTGIEMVLPSMWAGLPVDLLRPYPAEKMNAWQVGQRVGNVRNNDPELLEQAVSDRLF